MNPDETAAAEIPILAEAVEPLVPAPPRPWGFWATMGLSLGIIGFFIFVQAMVTVGFILYHGAVDPKFGDADIMRLATSGLLLSVAEWVSTPLTLALVVWLVKLRGQLSVREYLSLHKIPARYYVFWTAVLLAFAATTDGLSWIAGHRVVPEVMVRAYRTAVVPPLLWGAIIIAAPIFEELFFRGFFFRGIQQSRLGNAGAVLITSFFWSIIHVQYNAPLIFWIFLLGIVLGVARVRTNSTYLTIVLHALLNLIATIQVEVYIRQ